MITIEEAYELSKKGKEKAIIKQREEIERLIRERASNGFFDAYPDFSLYKEKSG